MYNLETATLRDTEMGEMSSVTERSLRATYLLAAFGETQDHWTGKNIRACVNMVDTRKKEELKQRVAEAEAHFSELPIQDNVSRKEAEGQLEEAKREMVGNITRWEYIQLRTQQKLEVNNRVLRYARDNQKGAGEGGFMAGITERTENVYMRALMQMGRKHKEEGTGIRETDFEEMVKGWRGQAALAVGTFGLNFAFLTKDVRDIIKESTFQHFTDLTGMVIEREQVENPS